jgi:hypothetical protein
MGHLQFSMDAVAGTVSLWALIAPLNSNSHWLSGAYWVAGKAAYISSLIVFALFPASKDPGLF